MSTLSDAQVDEILARYKAGGVTANALAAEFGVSPTHVGRLLRGRNRGDRNFGRSSALTKAHGNRKLTAEQRVEIRRRRTNGESGKLLAAEFGVSTSLVSSVLK